MQIAEGSLKKPLVEPQMPGFGILRGFCLNYILGK